MKHRWRTGAAGVLAALMMTTSAGAVGAAIEIDGTSLGAGEAWIENGTSYVTLAAFSRETGRSLSWDGTSAQVDGGDWTWRPLRGPSTCGPMSGASMWPRRCGW